MAEFSDATRSALVQALTAAGVDDEDTCDYVVGLVINTGRDSKVMQGQKLLRLINCNFSHCIRY